MKKSSISSLERQTATRPTVALAHQESNLRAAQKSLENAALVWWDSFTLSVGFHSEMMSTAAVRFHYRARPEHVLIRGPGAPRHRRRSRGEVTIIRYGLSDSPGSGRVRNRLGNWHEVHECGYRDREAAELKY
jgi:hypothetical protein